MHYFRDSGYLHLTKRLMPSTFIHQRKYWNQSLVAEGNLFTIKLKKSAGKCNCQLKVFMLPAYKPVRKLYFDKLISFSVLTLPVNENIFDRNMRSLCPFGNQQDILAKHPVTSIDN